MMPMVLSDAMYSYLNSISLIPLLLCLAACGGGGSESFRNSAPTIVSANSIAVEENIINIMRVNAVDKDGDSITYQIISGPDKPFLTIDSTTGQIDFIQTPDYENPVDADRNNSYEVQVSVSDGIVSVSQNITVNVTDILELIDSCRRAVRNTLSFYSDDFMTWGANPDSSDLVLSGDSKKVTFDLNNTAGSRLFVGNNVFLEKNKRYAFKVKVTEFVGSYSVDNFVIFGGSDNDFIGRRGVRFEQDGVYGMVFDYVGESSSYLLRIGVGTKGNDLSATLGSNSKFSVQDVMWEELDLEDFTPSEYVPPMRRWCFDYEKQNVLDISSGLIMENKGLPFNLIYKSVWAVTADSFGNDGDDFPQKLLEMTAANFALYVDAVPGRTLVDALNVFEELVTVQNYPEDVARPYGVIIQGGLNDIVTGATLNDLQSAILEMLHISDLHNLKPRIILTVSPFKNHKSWNTDREKIRIEYNTWLTTSLFGIPDTYVVDIAAPKSSGGLANDSDMESLDLEYDRDGLHPNSEGSAIIAKGIKNILDNL